jgi:DNA-binding response OmpR family regulator
LRRKLKSSNVNEDIVSVRSDGYKLVPGTSSK